MAVQNLCAPAILSLVVFQTDPNPLRTFLGGQDYVIIRVYPSDSVQVLISTRSLAAFKDLHEPLLKNSYKKAKP